MKYAKITFVKLFAFQQLNRGLDEILYLTRKQLLGNKKKKIFDDQELTNAISTSSQKYAEKFSGAIVEPFDDEVEDLTKGVDATNKFVCGSCLEQGPTHSKDYIALPVRSSSPECTQEDCLSKTVSKSSSYLGDLPQLVVTNDRLLSRNASTVASSKEGSRVPITFSWPSLDGQVSVHDNPSIDSNNSNVTEDMAQSQHGVGIQNRISSACDSGYSELDISGGTSSGNCGDNVIVEDNTDQKEDNSQDITYLEELQLYFDLDKLFDKTSHEENCFKELDLSICSDDSKGCSCSETSFPTATKFIDNSLDGFPSPSLTKATSAVMSFAQSSNFSANQKPVRNALHQHNVSKKYQESLEKAKGKLHVSRGDSSRSLPVTIDKKKVASDLSLNRRPSLPKVLAESTKTSREIFI